MMKTLVLMVLVLAVLPAQSQEASKREREALRRAQAALQQAQGERDALQAQKAALEQDRGAVAATADTLRKQLAAAQAQAQKLREDAMRVAAEHAAERERAAQAQRSTEAAAAEREATLRQQLAAMQRQRDERAQANSALVGELERRTAALEDARRRVRELHALGIEAVDRYRDKTPQEQRMQNEPVFGFGAVRIENVAEDLRTRLDAQRLAPSATAGSQ
jgi:chromosome segregation ATPase